jgi:uncharacterized oxidoreductase
MLNVDLLAPILLTRAALPSRRASGNAMVVNVTSGIALMGAPCQRKTATRPRERHSPIS